MGPVANRLSELLGRSVVIPGPLPTSPEAVAAAESLKAGEVLLLENLRFEKDAAVQKAIQRSADEIQQLKSTATSLRDELENLRFEKDAAVQQAIQRSTDEIAQLKNTAGNLRDELESAQYQLEEEVQKMRLQSENEIQHLKQTVKKLRDELEAKHA